MGRKPGSPLKFRSEGGFQPLADLLRVLEADDNLRARFEMELLAEN